MKNEILGEKTIAGVSNDRLTEPSEEPSAIQINRRTALRGVAAAGIAGSGLLTLGTAPVGASSPGGPVVLMGIDAEDGAPSGHGGNAIYQGVVNDIISKVTNGNTGILVIGGKAGKYTETFWNAIGAGTGNSITYVTSATDIATADFTNYAMLGVVSSEFETAGGLTNSENDALIARAADLASFVNSGGGLLGFSQDGLTNAWDYLGSIGGFTTAEESYDNVTATTEGNAVGIDDDNLDVCCWHDVFLTYPSFLDVLATHNGYSSRLTQYDGEAAALGGATVVIEVCAEKEVTLIAGQNEEVGTITILEDGDDISVTYTLEEGWYMTESHLHIAEDCDSIPQTGSGNPKVGRFEYGKPYDSPVQADTIVVSQESGWDAEDLLCVAAHAAVFKDTNDNEVYDSDVDREETAWGEGERFTERGNWAMHFEYEVCE